MASVQQRMNATLLMPATAALLLGACLSAQAQTPATVRFSSAEYATTEGYWGPLIWVEVVGPVPTNATVALSITGGTAAWEDFSLRPESITFAAGSASVSNVVQIMVHADGLREGTEWFTVALTNLTGGLTLGTPATAEVVIEDNPRQNPPHLDLDFDPGFVRSRTVLIQPDGRIIAATFGVGEDGMRVVRLLPDGSADPTWKTCRLGYVERLALQPNGQGLVVISEGVRERINRLNSDGSLDPHFRVDLPEWEYVNALAVQPDGRILVCGGGLRRFNPDGSEDPSFQSADGGELVLSSPEGRIFVGSSLGLTCLQADGAVDPEFAPHPELTSVRQFALQPDGKLVVLSYDTLIRLGKDGQPDANFTSRELPISGPYSSLVLAPDGKIWLLCPNTLLRLLPDGRTDADWWPSQLTTGPAGTWESRPRLLPAADGNLLVHGWYEFINGQRRRGLAKLLVNAPAQRCEVDAGSAVVLENAGRAAVRLVRCGDVSLPFTVAWRTEGGTAIPGGDYRPANGTLTFPSHESLGSIEVELFDNDLPDNDRTVRLSLEIPGAANPALPAVEFTIANDDLGFPPGGIRRLANGQWYLRATGCPISWDYGYVQAQHSADLRTWESASTDQLFFPFPETVISASANYDFFRLVLVPWASFR